MESEYDRHKEEERDNKSTSGTAIVMSLETLANEILLDFFEYLSTPDLLRIFYGLNTRFNTLLLNLFRSYHLDFRSISKRDFNTICEKKLPLLFDRIVSLQLSNNDETPKQIDSFVSAFHLPHFTRLRALSLDHLGASRIVTALIHQCHQLIRLDLINCAFSRDDRSIPDLFNAIWRLRKLVHCHIDIRFLHAMETILPTVTSTSLQYLTIEPFSYSSEDLARLFQRTPYLRHLHLALSDDTDDRTVGCSMSSIIRLRFSAYGSSAVMSDLLRNLPNLRYLTAETDEINWDGHLWQRTITNHLPRLKRFQLYMILRVVDNESQEQRVDSLLESFRTRFWLDERRWFVRCDRDRCEECEKNTLHLYTLPYISKNYFFHEVNFKTKSTCSTNSENYEVFENVRQLEYGLTPPSDNPFLSQFCFKNIRHLNVSLPVDASFISIVAQFDQLISIEVTQLERNNDSNEYPELQALLDQASRLYSLKFHSWSQTSTQMPPFQYPNPSVRRLDVQNIDQCYNQAQCLTLIHSNWARQCQVLCIAVEDRTSILDIIDMMTQIRVLNVLSRDDPYNPRDDVPSTATEDELIQWLEHRLPSAGTIVRNNENNYNAQFENFHSILIWMG